MKGSMVAVVTPYYNKPPQEGMRRHFAAVADAVHHPVFLYNVPGRTGVDLKPETVAKLATHPNIIGIKEATGELARVRVLRETCGAQFVLLSGDDATAREFMLQGGDGGLDRGAGVRRKPQRIGLVWRVQVVGNPNGAVRRGCRVTRCRLAHDRGAVGARAELGKNDERSGGCRESPNHAAATWTPAVIIALATSE